MPKPEARERAMINRYEYMVRFLGADGGPMEAVVLLAKSLTIAIDCASAVGAEIGAANFYIAPRASGRNRRPNAVARNRPDVAPFPDARQSGF
jgi:hypothetical protein